MIQHSNHKYFQKLKYKTENKDFFRKGALFAILAKSQLSGMVSCVKLYKLKNDINDLSNLNAHLYRYYPNKAF